MLSVGTMFHKAADVRAQAGLVGPNSVIQLAGALRAAADENATERVFARAGALQMLRIPPDAMIDETIPARLFASLWRELPTEHAAGIAYEAGRRTGAYLAANRIPALAGAVLRALPPHWAVPMLLKAIGRHAWTFAGSGTCSVYYGRPAVITIVRNPLRSPGCVWHVGVFETLFRILVGAGTCVRHSHCRVDGATADRFEIDVSGSAAGTKSQSP